MASISDMILMTGGMSPWAGLQRGLSSGLGTASTFQNLYGQALAQRYNRQKMKQEAAQAPLQSELLKSKLALAQFHQKYPGLASSSPMAQAVSYQKYLQDQEAANNQGAMGGTPMGIPQAPQSPPATMANMIAPGASVSQNPMMGISPSAQNQLSQAMTPDFMRDSMVQRNPSPLINRQISQAITPNFASSGGQLPPALTPMQQQASDAMGPPFFAPSQGMGGLMASQAPQRMPQPTQSQANMMGGAPQIQQRQPSASLLQQATQPSPLQQGGRQSPAEMMKQALLSQADEKSARKNYYKQLVEGGSYIRMPEDDKKLVVAYGMGMGLTPAEAVNYFMKGGTLKQLAQEKHLKLKDVKGIFSPSTAAIADVQKRKIAFDVVDSLQEHTTEALSHYTGPKLGKVPVKDIYDAIKGENPDRQARYLAALALNPEIAAGRTAAGAGTVGIRAIEHITNETYGQLGAFRAMVSPEVFAQSQKYVNEWMRDSMEAAGMSLSPLSQFGGEGQSQPTQQAQTPTAQASAPITMPEFNSKVEMKKWYMNLTPEQRAQVQA